MTIAIGYVTRHLRTFGRSTVAGIARQLSVTEREVEDVLDQLRGVEVVAAQRRGGRRVTWDITEHGRSMADGDIVEAIERRRRVLSLPMLHAGEGERRHECVRYEDCYSAFARKHNDETDGHCPRGCRHYEPEAPTRHRLWHDSAARKEWP